MLKHDADSDLRQYTFIETYIDSDSMIIVSYSNTRNNLSVLRKYYVKNTSFILLTHQMERDINIKSFFFPAGTTIMVSNMQSTELNTILHTPLPTIRAPDWCWSTLWGYIIDAS